MDSGSSTQMQSFDDHIENHHAPTRFFPCPIINPLLRSYMHLELGELLGGRSAAGENTEDVEADSLGKGPALADNDLVTGLGTERGRNVGGEVLVALLVTGVLGNEVKVFTADDDRPVHLGRHDGAGEDTAADRDLAGEGALLVCKGKIVKNVHRAVQLPASFPRSIGSPLLFA